MNPGRCAACKYLRRKCHSDCVFSPYFPSNNLQRFASIHKIFGASNVAKLLQHNVELKPVNGCVGLMFLLQQQIHNAETQLAKIRAEIAVLKSNAHHSQIQQFEDESDSNVFLPGRHSVAHPGLFNQASFGFI
ncbi:LOB domain-containing protein 23, putative [Theobroma cacao]|uniref:LOB domain-containing protein 23, putative n=1 Tax=Theobroma cacao TaxID=3641 RepID=A0A061E5V7_THECC|nr:LOB domain-containing protein 23, putative [Theobroma cacao]